MSWCPHRTPAICAPVDVLSVIRLDGYLMVRDPLEAALEAFGSSRGRVKFTIVGLASVGGADERLLDQQRE